MTYDSDTPMSGSNRSVSAMFDSVSDAHRAVDRLKAAGLPSSSIRMVEGSAAGAGATRDPNADKGFWDSLSDFFFPEEDRYTYAEGLSRGSCLVTASNLNSTDYETALDILDDDGTVDLGEREASWRSEGWGGYESSAYAAGGVPGSTGSAGYEEAGHAEMRPHHEGEHREMGRDESIPVVEERLSVGKRDISHGRVRVRAYTVEEPVSETVNLQDERVELERRPVDRAAHDSEDFRDRTLEAEEHREEAVVAKEARVVEEIGLRKVSDSHQETVSDTVRHTEVEVEDDRTNPSRTDR